MNAAKKRWLTIDLILIAIYCLIFFLGFGTDHHTAVWIHFLFVLFSHLVVWISLSIAKVQSRYVSVNMGMILPGIIYILFVFLAGTILMLTSPENIKLAVLVHLVLMLLYLVVFIVNTMALRHTESQEPDSSYNFINKAIYMLAMLQSTYKDDSEIKAAIDTINDKLRAGPYRSTSAMMISEQQIIQVMSECSDSILNKAEIKIKLDHILGLIDLRNAMGKNN